MANRDPMGPNGLWQLIFIHNLMEMLVTQLVKKFPTFHGNQRFITLFTEALCWTLYYDIW